MNFNTLDDQLKNLMDKPKDKRIIKRIILFKGTTILNAKLLDNHFAAKQFLVDEMACQFDTVVDYTNVNELVIQGDD